MGCKRGPTVLVCEAEGCRLWMMLSSGLQREHAVKGYGHGTFFNPGLLSANLSPNGSWDRFLTAPADRVAGGEAENRPERWSKSWLALPARFLLKVLVLLGLGPLMWLSMQAWDAVRAIIGAR